MIIIIIEYYLFSLRYIKYLKHLYPFNLYFTFHLIRPFIRNLTLTPTIPHFPIILLANRTWKNNKIHSSTSDQAIYFPYPKQAIKFQPTEHLHPKTVVPKPSKSPITIVLSASFISK